MKNFKTFKHFIDRRSALQFLSQWMANTTHWRSINGEVGYTRRWLYSTVVYKHFLTFVQHTLMSGFLECLQLELRIHLSTEGNVVIESKFGSTLNESVLCKFTVIIIAGFPTESSSTHLSSICMIYILYPTDNASRRTERWWMLYHNSDSWKDTGLLGSFGLVFP